MLDEDRMANRSKSLEHLVPDQCVCVLGLKFVDGLLERNHGDAHRGQDRIGLAYLFGIPGKKSKLSHAAGPMRDGPAETHDALPPGTRLAARDGSSYKQALQALKPGDKVSASAPMGDFVLPKLLQTPLVFVAGGIGITPFLSMFKWLASTGEDRPIKFIHAVRTEDDLAFQAVFEAAGQHVTTVVSEPTAAWGGERGHVSAEMIIGLEAPTADSLVYVSGPEKLVEDLLSQLKTAGLRKDQLVGDYFPGYPAES